MAVTALFGQAIEDNEWQRRLRDRILIPQFYAKRFGPTYATEAEALGALEAAT